MSNQTFILSNHTLNTSSLEVVAQQLSTKLQATVVYGYCNTIEVPALQWEANYKMVVLGEVKHSKATKTIYLLDSYYLHRILVENHSDKLEAWFKEDIFLLHKIKESKNLVLFEISEHPNDLNYFLYIFPNALGIEYLDTYDWRSFTRFFSYASKEDTINSLKEWRKEHQTFIHLFGGNEMMVYEDIAEDFENFIESKTTTFEQLKQKAINEHPNSYCSISNFLEEKKYIGLPKYDDSPLTKEDIYRLQNGLQLEPKNKEKCYELFFDDFRDLKIDN